jgi:phenylacetate-CoA ligase
MSDPLPLSAVPDFGWPAVASPPAASMLALQWQLEESQAWTREQLLEAQFQQLRVLLQHAVRHVPHYRGLLEAAGLRGVMEIDPVTFARLPVLKKGELRENEANLTASVLPRGHGERFYTYTTGSTGEPTRVQHSQATQFMSDAMAIYDHLLHRRDLGRKYAAIQSSVKRSTQPAWGAINAVFPTGPAVFQSSSADVDEQLDWLMQERPAFLQGYSSNLLALVLRSIETGRVPQGLLQLIGRGDVPAPDLPELARRAWNCDFVATYSCMEVGPLASQCPGLAHYHVLAPAVYLEVLREDGSPCAPGEAGRVVVTPLHNFAMPLIRYELGDYAEVGPPCPAGRGWPTLARVVGRYRNMLRDPDGKVTWPSFPGEAWYDLVPVRKVRLVQTAAARIEVQYVMDRELSEGERDKVRAMLVAKLGYPFEIAFVRQASIERTPDEKWEDFVSLTGTP